MDCQALSVQLNGGGSEAVSESDANQKAAARRSFILLNDQPVDDPHEDLLGMSETAAGIAAMLVASGAASPFVVAVDAGWGMGKSTLLRQVEARLSGNSKDISAVWFNAWTADGGNALEALIKSVLESLDSNVVRRWIRRIARRRGVLTVVWIGFGVVCRFFGIARLVDELWRQLAVDTTMRNELRGAIQGMLTDWMNHDGGSNLSRDPSRCMVVFIDDLDRCSDDAVVQICEAVKLYLDVPGLIFVIACDQSALARGVSAVARGGADEGRSYLEKIVQVVYRIPPPDDPGIRRLIRGFAEKSRTGDVIDNQAENILAERTGRNPRKIKRLINSFILEYQLDPTWREPPLGAGQLVTAILLYHLYAPFYDLLVRDESRDDLIGDLLDYAEIREKAVEEPPRNSTDPLWGKVERVFKEYNTRWDWNSGESLADALKRLERRLPEEFPQLAGKSELMAILRGLGDRGVRLAFKAQLFSRPLTTLPVYQLEPEVLDAPGGPLATPSDMPLPEVSAGGLSGLLEILNARGGREGLAELADDLTFEVDDLLPLVDAAVMLGLARVEDAELEITNQGREFATGDIDESKMLFGRLASERAPLIKAIVNGLRATSDRTLREGFFLDLLRRGFSEDEIRRQLDIAIDWGRYGDLFEYDAESRQLVLGPDRAKVRV
jgi:hypothetical protein